ncbi:MAG: GDP-mannose 4,6-dehydratase [Myxococcota bacterium]|nr:GDP-mannose 4,6-dehydratase [Myxococcota bacterium]
MDKFLVTGAMGFVGSHWCEHLLRKGKKVFGLDLGPFYPELLEHPNFVFAQDTIKNYQLLKNLVDRVDCVCHFAGIAEPQQYIQFPRKVIDITAVVGLNLIEMCRCTGKLFLFTSTSEIYGKSDALPFKEDGDRVLGATTTKRWCYSSSKAVLEHYLDACARARELDHITVRLFNIYGPRLHGRVISTFIEDAMRGRDLVIHGNGEQTRCFTYVDDMVEAFDRLVSNRECYNSVFNVGNPIETSMKMLASTVQQVAASNSIIRNVNYDQAYGSSYEDIPRRVPDISKITRFTGWTPATSLERGIAATIAYINGAQNRESALQKRRRQELRHSAAPLSIN